jgi:hypothetical protein
MSLTEFHPTPRLTAAHRPRVDLLVAACVALAACGSLNGEAASAPSPIPGPDAAALSALPRIEPADMRYLGAFRLPQGRVGASTFEWGGHGIAPHWDAATGTQTLYLTGHTQADSMVAQVEVPRMLVRSDKWSALPQGRVLQPFVEITQGKLGSIGSLTNGAPVHGLLAWQGRLVVAATQTYGSDQVRSHGVASQDLRRPDFKGFYAFSGAAAPPRALGGPMTPIPLAWQPLFGGPALTGNCCMSIIGATSAGPSATVFDPSTVGTADRIPGKTVLYYPIDAALCGAEGCEATRNDVFNLTSRVRGMAFVRDTRSILFFGSHGTGPYCYGTVASCRTPGESDYSGPRAAPYEHRIWAFDAADLVAVKDGRRRSHSPRPYAIWSLPDLKLPAKDVLGAGFDPETGRLYIAQEFGIEPRIDVYELRPPAAR